jgi:hypothetical protein
MIAWFPDEHTIRIIGPECFASFNLEGHTTAYKAFLKEQEEKRNNNFLLSHLGFIGQCIEVIDANIPAVKEVDRVREILSRRIPHLIDFDLWRHVRADQRLKTESQRTAIQKDRLGEEREVTVRESLIYGPVIGHIMLQPKPKLILNKLDICKTRLKMIDFGDRYAEHLATLPYEEKRKLAKFMEKEVMKAHDLFAEVEEVRRFLKPENVATLRGWGKHKDCPTRLYISFAPDGRQLHLGKTDDQLQTMTVRPEFWTTLLRIPILSAHKPAAANSA